jgi:putative sigma-54 modulation protein
MQTLNNEKIIISGVHMELTEALKARVMQKVEKLFRHDAHIIRVRVELIHDHHKKHEKEFIAKGHVEINGPDIVITVASNNEYESIDLLVNKLDRKLNRRARLKRIKRKIVKAVDIAADLPKAIMA